MLGTSNIYFIQSKKGKMELKYKLLNHPFYQDWEMGKISAGQLSKYAASYREFIERMPSFWSSISVSFGNDLAEIIAEETNHIELWDRWAYLLSKDKYFPSMQEIVNEFDKMTPSELLGALHSFEVQQPEVALTKKNGLLRHYGFERTDLLYFDEHINEQKHIDKALEIAAVSADRIQFENGLARGSELLYRGLDLFLE
ncbi:MAG: pyrroloquinoline-quinone synthase [Bacteroidota bacterium]|nr:pyrroloquinoline-quinone synthase [Bacteroidota bacterium]